MAPRGIPADILALSVPMLFAGGAFSTMLYRIIKVDPEQTAGITPDTKEAIQKGQNQLHNPREAHLHIYSTRGHPVAATGTKPTRARPLPTLGGHEPSSTPSRPPYLPTYHLTGEPTHQYPVPIEELHRHLCAIHSCRTF
ncbi:hypothetical protein Vafri_12377 [Volvox africanus]|uniref:Uncharacterized protein n=1 Tax=Volvox africanus TaxID=51714 RepID=A0A8J4F5B2_9CHLO|nr:hypothetical protein Vafri_12377 [Volvox africanus]